MEETYMMCSLLNIISTRVLVRRRGFYMTFNYCDDVWEDQCYKRVERSYYHLIKYKNACLFNDETTFNIYRTGNREYKVIKIKDLTAQQLVSIELIGRG